jgi:hypothetical protein
MRFRNNELPVIRSLLLSQNAKSRSDMNKSSRSPALMEDAGDDLGDEDEDWCEGVDEFAKNAN